MKKFLNYLFNSRLGFALYMVACSLLFSAILGGFFSLFADPGSFWSMCRLIFFYFSFPGIVSAILLLITPIAVELSYGFGCGLYYGTIVIAAITHELGWYMPNTARFILSFVIAALILYVFWLEKYKNS